ncbi:peptidase [Cohnella kolymensis]|uniref:Peptidase n=1 Tax=Cohnella kolymensis TaxID=1590652 RepID=A0ABR5A436_9BACL|nr:hypothetical protein [Cohnella kolymensis]KIL35403.1 peptidase [Cohnella kolymensis]
MSNCIALDRIVVENNRVDYYFSVSSSLQKYFSKNNHMFLEYNHDLAYVPHSILAIPFAANVLPLVWITDSTLMLNELDLSFSECIEDLRLAYQEMFPSVAFKGTTKIKKCVENSYVSETKSASLFSGGLDAFTTFIRIKHNKPMLITEYGWHHHDIQHSEVWEADKKHVVSFAEAHGLENILIQSNYGNFMISETIDREFHKKLGFSWWEGLHHGLAIISAAIPMAFKFKVENIFIASSLHIGHSSKCASDPSVDNEIKYASGHVYHDAYELTRQDKVKVVVDYYAKTNIPVQLRVCFKNKKNCCNCEKCLRTILGIVAEGYDPNNFGFDIPDHLSQHLSDYFKEHVKFLSADVINLYWIAIQQRMDENKANVLYPDLLEWFLDYDFAANQKRALLHYRITKFFPILKRKISDRLNNVFAQKV